MWLSGIECGLRVWCPTAWSKQSWSPMEPSDCMFCHKFHSHERFRKVMKTQSLQKNYPFQHSPDVTLIRVQSGNLKIRTLWLPRTRSNSCFCSNHFCEVTTIKLSENGAINPILMRFCITSLFAPRRRQSSWRLEPNQSKRLTARGPQRVCTWQSCETQLALFPGINAEASQHSQIGFRFRARTIICKWYECGDGGPIL